MAKVVEDVVDTIAAIMVFMRGAEVGLVSRKLKELMLGWNGGWRRTKEVDNLMSSLMITDQASVVSKICWEGGPAHI